MATSRNASETRKKAAREGGTRNISEINGDIKSLLEVKKIDPCLEANGEEHHTNLFQLMWRRDQTPELVVRRGQPFYLKISLSRSYSKENDSVSFIFTLNDCKTPNLGQGTIIAVPMVHKKFNSPKTDKTAWSAELESTVSNTLSVKITPPANCLVGKWNMDIDTKLSQNRTLSYSYPGSIYILFNAWCSADDVYIRENEKRNEYVLAETGLVYRGTHKMIKPCVWKYSQFEKDILDCSLMLVKDIGKVPVTSWSDPVKISRALTAAVNAPDDNGVIMGNWTNEFDGGTSPSSWVGSMKILQTYYKKKKPVKYGQCWVFAGVLTTVCRALGIPTRPVTCFICGHDSKNSLTIDHFIGDDGKHMEELESESVWNFHVWVEAWMKRPDISSEFDGWQVIDATPQELSDDQYKCGPTSVFAIKTGQVLKPYDAGFAFSAVNADVVYWRYFGPTQPLKLISKETDKIGKKLCTKAVGLWQLEDITFNYKYPENSKEERLTMLNALKKSGNIFSRYYLNEDFNDVKFDFRLVDDIIIGSPFKVTLKMINKSQAVDHQVSVSMTVQPVTYTGKQHGTIKTIQRDITIDKRTGEEIDMLVTYEEYSQKMIDQCAFSITCHAHVKNTDFDYYAEDDFRVKQPDIKMDFSEGPRVNKHVKVKAWFSNPLPITIKKGFLSIDGPGTVKPTKNKFVEIQPHSEISQEFTLIPQYIGKHTIVAKFTSKELDDVDGFIHIMVDE